MLAGRFPEVPIIVGSDRFAGVCAAADFGADVAVLDDGFQHRRLTRDLDVVVLSARDPLGNGRLLPAGPLREPAASLRRADLLVRGGGASESMESIHGVPEPRLGTLHAVRRSESWVDFRGEAVPKPDHVVAFCGIGTPRSFRELIESEGIAIDAFVGFPDHHSFSDAEMRRLVDLAVEHEAPLLTTEKDLARLDGLRVDPSIHGRLLGLRMSLEITNEQTLRVAFAEALGAKRTP
jgi:tetraacyldisaccharide 4'-kinase